jgi:hypothetical protein
VNLAGRAATDVGTQRRLVGALCGPRRDAGCTRPLDEGDRVEFGGPVAYREADDAFDMAALFESIEGKEGSIAAIHCDKGLCYRIAAAARGGYQAIEEMAARTMTDLARQWDSSADADRRLGTLSWLFGETFSMQRLAEGENVVAISRPTRSLTAPGPALAILTLTRMQPTAVEPRSCSASAFTPPSSGIGAWTVDS